MELKKLKAILFTLDSLFPLLNTSTTIYLPAPNPKSFFSITAGLKELFYSTKNLPKPPKTSSKLTLTNSKMNPSIFLKAKKSKNQKNSPTAIKLKNISEDPKDIDQSLKLFTEFIQTLIKLNCNFNH